MKKFIFLGLILIGMNVLVSDTFAQVRDVFAEPNRLYSEGKFREAEIAYKNLLETVADPPTRAKVIYNLGMTYQQLTEYKNAIDTFDLIFSMDVNDKEPGGNLMQAYRNYRHSAQWEIGNSYFAMGDFENALNAYRTAREKFPYHSWCGTCQASVELQYYETIAICFEHLGRYEEAVNSYMKIYHPRMIELYEFNGQLDDIKNIITAIEERKITELENKYAWRRDYARKSLPTVRLDKFIEIYDMENSGNIKGLIKLSGAKQNSDGYYSTIIAKLLSRHPQEVIRQIKNAAANQANSYIYLQTLGFIGTPEAMEILKQRAETTVSWNDAISLAKVINSAGESGQKTFSELDSAKLSPNMKLAIQRVKDERNGNRASNIKEFPQLKKAKLPIVFNEK